MTLGELITTLDTQGLLPNSKDKRTAARYLSKALGYDGPDACLLDEICREEATWNQKLEAHYTTLEAAGHTISAATRRNVRNNLRTIMRQAEAHGYLGAALPTPLLPRTRHLPFILEQHRTSPYMTTYRPQTGGPRHFRIRQEDWPPDCQAGWEEYLTQGGHRHRAITLKTYRNYLSSYLGYIAHVVGRTPTWADVFAVPMLTAFHRWHGARLGKRSTVTAHLMIHTFAAMAKVLDHPHAQALADFRNKLPATVPMHIKRNHWVSLAQLEAVADACLADGRRPLVDPHRTLSPGVQRAAQFQTGLILKLLVRIPLRQRNVRELQLERNLYQDQGSWWLHFEGEDLKIGERGGQANVFQISLTKHAPDLIPVLEEFRTVFRPRFPGAQRSPYLFLAQNGHPLSGATVRRALTTIVSMRTGQRFYPHLIRTIWATEFLATERRDYATAAVRLGDTVKVVMQRYHDLDEDTHNDVATDFVAQALRKGCAGR